MKYQIYDGIFDKASKITEPGLVIEKKINIGKPIDVRTEFGKGNAFKTCDGHYVSSMDEVRAYNKLYYDRMMAIQKGHNIKR